MIEVRNLGQDMICLATRNFDSDLPDESIMVTECAYCALALSKIGSRICHQYRAEKRRQGTKVQGMDKIEKV